MKKIPVLCGCKRNLTTCDGNCDYQGNPKIILDLKPETHRNAPDCTCYECMRKETKDFFKTEQIKSTTYVLG